MLILPNEKRCTMCSEVGRELVARRRARGTSGCGSSADTTARRALIYAAIARRTPRARLSSTRISVTGAAGEHGATARLDVARHRVRQFLAAALRDRLSVDVDRRDHDVERLPGAFLLGQDLRRERPVEHHGLDEIVLEIHLDPSARRQRELLQAPQPGLARLERTRHRRRRRGRREKRFQEAVLDQCEIIVHTPITLRVALRITRDACAGLVDRAIDHDARAAVAIGVARDVIGRRQVVEAVLLELAAGSP